MDLGLTKEQKEARVAAVLRTAGGDVVNALELLSIRAFGEEQGQLMLHMAAAEVDPAGKKSTDVEKELSEALGQLVSNRFKSLENVLRGEPLPIKTPYHGDGGDRARG